MKLRDLAALMRISNLPTVWSNVLVGVLAGHVVVTPAIARGPSQPPIDQFMVLVLMLGLAVSLIYCGGMVMNDLVDRQIDSHERPDRPIPSGRIRPATAALLFVAMFAAGLVIVITLVQTTGSPDASIGEPLVSFAVLVVLVVCYNLLHRHAAAIMLMGLCRVFIVIACAAVLAADQLCGASAALWIVGPAVTLFFYTITISIVARHEAEHERGPQRVMNMIAAMPLLDAAWLIAMGFWPVSLISITCAGLTRLAHRKVAGS